MAIKLRYERVVKWTYESIIIGYQYYSYIDELIYSFLKFIFPLLHFYSNSFFNYLSLSLLFN